MYQKMKNRLRIMFLLLAVLGGFCLFGGHGTEVHAATTKYVTASTLAVRKKPSASSKKFADLPRGTKVTCYGKSGNWTKIRYKSKYRYVYSTYLSSKKPSVLPPLPDPVTDPLVIPNPGTETIIIKPVEPVPSTSKGVEVINYAKKFLGNPYVYGGTSLTKGTDCSGFTQSIYRHFGYTIPRTSTDQRKAGRAVAWANKQPGDLICYEGHVALYMGNNQVIHASNAKEGIKITSPANYRKVVCVRRILPNP